MEVIVPSRLISALTHVLVFQASPESTVGLLFHAAPGRAKMVELARIQRISVLTVVFVDQVSPESNVKLNLIVTLRLAFVRVGFRVLTTVSIGDSLKGGRGVRLLGRTLIVLEVKVSCEKNIA